MNAPAVLPASCCASHSTHRTLAGVLPARLWHRNTGWEGRRWTLADGQRCNPKSVAVPCLPRAAIGPRHGTAKAWAVMKAKARVHELCFLIPFIAADLTPSTQASFCFDFFHCVQEAAVRCCYKGLLCQHECFPSVLPLFQHLWSKNKYTERHCLSRPTSVSSPLQRG